MKPTMTKMRSSKGSILCWMWAPAAAGGWRSSGGTRSTPCPERIPKKGKSPSKADHSLSASPGATPAQEELLPGRCRGGCRRFRRFRSGQGEPLHIGAWGW